MRLKKKETAKNLGIGIGGKIKIGEKRKSANGKEFPVSLDYFIPYSDNAEYNLAFRQQIGEKPSSIKIMFVDDDAIHECMELRDSSGAKAAYSDGENLWKIDDNGNFSLSDPAKIQEFGGMDRAMEMLASKYKGKWKHTVTMRFVIIGLKGILCQWQLRTNGSASSINNIVGAFDHMKESLGTSVGIVWDLSVKKVKSDKSGVVSVYPVLSLTANMGARSIKALSEYVQAGQISARQMIALDESGFQRLESNIKQIQIPQQTTKQIDI